MNTVNDKLWLVEWLVTRRSFRISKFVDPNYTVAYEDSWQDAVRDIRANYPIDGLIIFIRKEDGNVDYWCDGDYV